MAYIGNEPVIGQWRKLDDISGSFNGSLTSFTTQVGGVNVTAGSANQLLVSLGGVLQEPGTDYSVSSSTITFTTAPAASLSFFAVLAGDALNTSVPADGSITTAKLGANLTVDLDLGSAGTPSLTFDADSGLFSGGDNQVAVSTSGVERVEFGASEVVFNDGGADYDFRVEGDTNANLLFVDASTDRVGIGTSSPSDVFHVEGTIRTSSSTNSAQFANNFLRASASGTFFFDQSTVGQSFQYRVSNASANDTTALTITSAGNVGIGATSPNQSLVVSGNTRTNELFLANGQASSPTLGTEPSWYSPAGATAALSLGGSEVLRVDSSGRFLVGTNTAVGTESTIETYRATDNRVFIASTNATTGNAATLQLGPANSVAGAQIICTAEDDFSTSANRTSRLTFTTRINGTLNERLRIRADGLILIGTTSIDPANLSTGNGVQLATGGAAVQFARQSAAPLITNRAGTDGTIVDFRHQGISEGTISVSGTTVSYNGAHLSRWSQLPGGVERTEILRGSVLSNIDEMCEWGEQANEQLNRMKVSDVEGDKNIAGVFQAWDDDDDTYTNDFYCAMTGDFIIRIAQGVTVERGDLLMSAGDGTAKPQDDGIIRSKTIAKVTSTNVSCTYDDGSYCVPCVLMAC